MSLLDRFRRDRPASMLDEDRPLSADERALAERLLREFAPPLPTNHPEANPPGSCVNEGVISCLSQALETTLFRVALDTACFADTEMTCPVPFFSGWPGINRISILLVAIDPKRIPVLLDGVPSNI